MTLLVCSAVQVSLSSYLPLSLTLLLPLPLPLPFIGARFSPYKVIVDDTEILLCCAGP